VSGRRRSESGKSSTTVIGPVGRCASGLRTVIRYRKGYRLRDRARDLLGQLIAAPDWSSGKLIWTGSGPSSTKSPP
jgi:hypothetical protein